MNPQYERLMNDGSFAGFKRTVVEYLRPGADKWQLKELESNHTTRLVVPPIGIAILPRARLGRRDKK